MLSKKLLMNSFEFLEATLRDLWIAISTLSKVLRKSPVLLQYGETVAGCTAIRNRSPVQNALHDLLAGVKPLEAQPFLLAWSLQFRPEVTMVQQAPGGAEFWKLAEDVAKNICILVEWFRSRLPRYPALEIPHIDSNSSLASSECFFTSRFPWYLHFRSLNLQRCDEPPQLSRALKIPKDFVEDFQGSVRVVSETLRQTDTWKTFVSASEHLTKDDIGTLSEVCKTFRVSTEENKVTQLAGNKLYRRTKYKDAVLAALESEAPHKIRKYFKAFRDVEWLIQVTIDLLSTLVVYGPMNRINEDEYEELVSYRWETATSVKSVEIKTPILKVPFDRFPYMIRLGNVVYLEDEIPGLSGAVLVEAIVIGTDHFKLIGELLRDSVGVFEMP